MQGQPHLESSQRAVFIDRDGVINRSILRNGRPFAPTSLDELDILPGVGTGLDNLRDAGFLNVVVTNQPDLATGKQTRAGLEMIHAQLLANFAIDAIKVCPHVDADACDCRKPKPGMLVASAREFGIDLSASWMIGDRWRDVAAGQSAGCRCCFIDYNYDEPRPAQPFFAARSLADAARVILVQSQPREHGESR